MDIANPQLKLRKKRKRLLLIGGGVLAVLVIVLAVAWLGPALPTAERSSLWIGIVERGDMLREVRATGTLVPRHKRWISAATAAQVENILVWPGAKVTPDTVLMKLSNPEVADALRNAQAKVAAARAEVASKRAQLQSQWLDERSELAKAKSDYASTKVKADADAKAMKLKLIPRVQYQQEKIALTQLKERVDIERQRVASFAGNMKAQMDAVKAQLTQQQSNLKLRQRQMDALNVKAGIAGVLQQVAVQEGAQVTEGANLAQVARPDVLIARLKVPEVQAKDVALGMPVSVDTHNGIVKGTVERIDPAVTDGSVLVDVRLTGKLPPGARPDLSVDGRIRIAQLKNVLSVGRPALAKADSDISLFRLNADGVATRVPVRIGATSVDRVEIRKGLKAGDKVILSDTSQWDNYDRIKVE
ncbi:MAG TPA: efflux RND transporter periplasmic adaptor subunit [Oleiagrimonas sp.]|nr:efflux RND transporter periplasmic adaptor subunit [Oleiagrimonas sp.]